ncbi:globin domain-containing protein [Gordonia sp. ABSL1-1]|uniref:globin domain-containing protein n=1 Tax=Gordonia sp. ABSL1-1 TaxID=3053923 RepID=UPI0025735CA6|nr:globin domain-containing protein [Gordonia sp. ABSL1-1]MDL9936766.1 globin domain-containing protein [Gordonia sp. ABSL1-1]
MDKELLETSLALVDLPDDGLTVRFYDKLFELHPEVAPMFGRDTRQQASMLRTAVISVLDHLDDAAWLTSTLGSLGRRHADWGVTEPMYGIVAEVLVATMAEIGADAWTDEMSEAWTQALTAVAGLMLAGYPESAEGAA